jgi:hypothetical protein
MNIEDLEPELANIKYRLGLLEMDRATPAPTAKLMVAVKMTIEVLQKWVREKGRSLQDEDNPDYREVCSTLPMLETAYKEYASQPTKLHDKDNLDKVCDELEGPVGDPKGEPGPPGPLFENKPRPVMVIAAESGPLAPQIARKENLKSGPANFTFDRLPRTVPHQIVLGSVLKEMLPQDKLNYSIFIENKEPNGPDIQVNDRTPYHVDGLDMYSVPPAVFGSGSAVVSFIVNAQRYSMCFKEHPPLIPFEKIVSLADPGFYERHRGNPAPLHTITYKHKVQPTSTFKMSGSLVPGEAVEVTHGMIIDAAITSGA